MPAQLNAVTSEKVASIRERSAPYIFNNEGLPRAAKQTSGSID
jgi:hypothetical protein